MRFSDFYRCLENIAPSYSWDVNDKNKIVATIQRGPAKGFTLNPITALAHKIGLGFFDNTRDGTEVAASLMGFSRKFARDVYSATLSTYNHGNTQVIRGRMRSALEV